MYTFPITPILHYTTYVTGAKVLQKIHLLFMLPVNESAGVTDHSEENSCIYVYCSRVYVNRNFKPNDVGGKCPSVHCFFFCRLQKSDECLELRFAFFAYTCICETGKESESCIYKFCAFIRYVRLLTSTSSKTKKRGYICCASRRLTGIYTSSSPSRAHPPYSGQCITSFSQLYKSVHHVSPPFLSLRKPAVA